MDISLNTINNRTFEYIVTETPIFDKLSIKVSEGISTNDWLVIDVDGEEYETRWYGDPVRTINACMPHVYYDAWEKIRLSEENPFHLTGCRFMDLESYTSQFRYKEDVKQTIAALEDQLRVYNGFVVRVLDVSDLNGCSVMLTRYHRSVTKGVIEVLHAERETLEANLPSRPVRNEAIFMSVASALDVRL